MTDSQPRSTFVTVLAWIFIVLSGFATVISILQNIMIQTMFLNPAFEQVMRNPPPAPGVPPFFTFVFGHFAWLFLAFLVLCVCMLVMSIGLLKRWNWARLGFVGLMVLGIVWNLAGVGIQFVMFSSMQEQFPVEMSRGMLDMRPILIAISVASALFAIAVSVLLGWIVKKLLSAPIAAEFRK